MSIKGMIHGTILILAMGATASMAQMQAQAFREKAGNNQSRCIGAREATWCHSELEYALSKSLITQEAYNWGRANEFYPVISRHDTVEAVCKCGCFEQSTKILLTAPEGAAAEELEVKELSLKHLVWALEQDSALSRLRLSEFAVTSIVKGQEDVALYAFTLANGRILKLTQHHGTVLSSGIVIAAKDVKVGDQFIDALSGEAVPVLAISRELTAADVYNFKVNGEDRLNHIVVAEGVLVGEVTWQNSLASELGQIHIRR